MINRRLTKFKMGIMMTNEGSSVESSKLDK